MLLSRVCLLGVFAFTPVRAQTLLVPQGSTEREIVARAENEGAVYPRAQDSSRAHPPGRKCVDAYNTYGMSAIRSGEFSIGGSLGGYLNSSIGGSPGGYLNSTDGLRAGHRGKVWWHPDHGALDMPPLVVRGRSLTNPRDTVRFETKDVAWPVSDHRPVPPAERDYFFPSGISIPRPGRWLVIATSGANWGCFILRVA